MKMNSNRSILVAIAVVLGLSGCLRDSPCEDMHLAEANKLPHATREEARA